MILLNFTHPLTAAHRTQIEQLTHQPILRELGEMVHFDDHSYAAQIHALVDRLGLTSKEWQTAGLLLNPPGFAPVAAALLAELHGRTGYFVPVSRLRKLSEQIPIVWEVAEIINLQALREDARSTRRNQVG